MLTKKMLPPPLQPLPLSWPPQTPPNSRVVEEKLKSSVVQELSALLSPAAQGKKEIMTPERLEAQRWVNYPDVSVKNWPGMWPGPEPSPSLINYCQFHIWFQGCDPEAALQGTALVFIRHSCLWAGLFPPNSGVDSSSCWGALGFHAFWTSKGCWERCGDAAVWGWPFGRPSKKMSCEHSLGGPETAKAPTQLASVSIKSLGKT